MSCDLAAAAFLFLAASNGAPAAAPPQPATLSVAKEPLYADIIGRAGRLKDQAEGMRKLGGGPDAVALPGLDDFGAEISALAALDMKGHFDLAERGTDGDLKCILKGISQDLGKRLEELKAAKSWREQDGALRDMAYLLNDNVEVITAPPAPPV